MNQFNDHQENQSLTRLQKYKPIADDTAGVFSANYRYRKEATCLQECAENVRIYLNPSQEPTKTTWYCHRRHCPICQDRFSARWRVRLQWILRTMRAEGYKPHWLFLTLTVRNCPVTELRSQIQAMHKAFGRLIKRNALRHVHGSIRFLEVDQGQDAPETAHPHFHCLLLVAPTMHGGKDYLSRDRWAQLWKESLQVHYTPEVDVQRLSAEGQSADEQVLRRLSYSTKPRVTIPEPAWFLEMVEQLHHTQRAIVTGQLKHWTERFKAANQDWHLNELTSDPKSDPHKRYRWDPEQADYEELPS